MKIGIIYAVSFLLIAGVVFSAKPAFESISPEHPKLLQFGAIFVVASLADYILKRFFAKKNIDDNSHK